MKNDLPVGWKFSTVEEITSRIHYGYTASSTLTDTGVKFLRITDIQDKKVDWENVPFCEISEKDLEKYLLKAGDLVFARTGATVGKSFLLKNDVPKSVFASYLIRLIVSKNIDNNFLYYFFNSDDYWQQITDGARGIGQPNVNAQTLSQIKLPIPPLAEQKRIVAKLDAAFAHLETLKQGLERIPELLKKFRQTVLSHAVTGKLTEDWREGKELDEWREGEIGDLVRSIEAGKNFTCPSIPVNHDTVGLVKISAVTWGKFDHRETKTVTDKKQIEPKLFINQGDFLFSRANTLELVGASVIVDEIEHKIMLSDKIWRVHFNNDISKKYVNLFLKSRIGRNEIESRASGNQLSMRNISQPKFKEIPVPIPPLEEQQEIVTRVEGLLAQADALEARYKALKAHLDKLPGALLAKAFRGELVPQHPTGVPAPPLPPRPEPVPARRGPGQQQTFDF